MGPSLWGLVGFRVLLEVGEVGFKGRVDGVYKVNRVDRVNIDNEYKP